MALGTYVWYLQTCTNNKHRVASSKFYKISRRDRVWNMMLWCRTISFFSTHSCGINNSVAYIIVYLIICRLFRLIMGLFSAVLVYYTHSFINDVNHNGHLHFFLIYEVHRIFRLVRIYNIFANV